MTYSKVITCLLFSLFLVNMEAQEETDFFTFWQSHTDIENALFKHFSSIAYDQLNAREREVSKLKTKQDWLQRQSVIKRKLKEVVGTFPEKTPLNTEVTGTIKKEGYRIEKTIYESRPGNYVTGALYIPEGVSSNAPTIFYACGHTLNGFKSPTYQHVIVNLVKKGFVVFTIDPMGQGERYEYWDVEKDEPRFPNPDHAHSYAGAQCLITGYSTANYFIWDVIRGIDYLLTRKEVDPKRLGMTGRSGGGNLTAYIGAFDERILAAAPECYITSYEYLYRTRGPQCAEQNLYQMVEHGLDHADFIEARAPKPSLIVSTTRDFFSIQGTRESYQEAKGMYQVLGAPENLLMVEDDAVHQSTKKNREAVYTFFQKELNNPGSPEDWEVEVPTEEELQVTKTGQLLTSLSGKTIYDMNKDRINAQKSALSKSRLDMDDHLRESVLHASEISGMDIPSEYGDAIFSGRYTKSDHTLEKYLIPGSGDYHLPTIVLKPVDGANGKTILFLDSKGMNHAFSEDGLIFRFLNEGYNVLLTDLPGIGSLGPGYLKGDSYINGISYNQWFGAALVGKSNVGLRAQDILRIVHFAKNGLGETYISAISSGPLAGELLHAAVYEKDIKSVGILSSFISYMDIANARWYTPEYIPFMVPGAIQKYDLADLMAAFCPRKLFIIDPRTGTGSTFTETNLMEGMGFPLEVYKKNAPGNISISRTAMDNEELTKKIISFL